MNKDDLFDAIGGADDELLERCQKPMKRHSLRPWLSIAACACIIILPFTLYWLLPSGGSGSSSTAAPMTDSEAADSADSMLDNAINQYGDVSEQFTTYPDGNASAASPTDSYAFPNRGTCGYETNVTAAREHYAGQDVTYLLAIDIFKWEDGLDNPIELTKTELGEEYQRLSDSGYSLYQTRYWTYYGDKQQKWGLIVVGAFTEEQLADFAVNENYGYFFRFPTNGDGSAVSAAASDFMANFSDYGE